MEKITLKLFEFYNLDAELNGLVNQGTGEKLSSGLIQEKLPLTTKYWLTSLGKTVAAEKTAVEELKNELIKKYGKEDDRGGIAIPMVVDELDADGFTHFAIYIDKASGVYFSEALNYSDNRQEFNIFRNEDPTYVVRLFDFLSSQAKNLGSSKSYNKIRANIGNRFNF